MKRYPKRRYGAVRRFGGLAGGYSRGGAGGRARFVPEIHYLLTNIATDVTSTGTVAAVNLIAQGDSQNNRNSNDIRMHSLEIRSKFSNEVLMPKHATGIRQVVVYDRQANGALPAWTDVFVAETMISPRRVEFKNRFVILSDKIIRMPALYVPTGGGLPPVGTIQWYDKTYVHLKNMETMYTASTGVIGSVSAGALIVMQLGDIAAGTDDIDQTTDCFLAFSP